MDTRGYIKTVSRNLHHLIIKERVHSENTPIGHYIRMCGFVNVVKIYHTLSWAFIIEVTKVYFACSTAALPTTLLLF